MLTAQRDGDRKIGMNRPGNDNRQFALISCIGSPGSCNPRPSVCASATEHPAELDGQRGATWENVRECL